MDNRSLEEILHNMKAEDVENIHVLAELLLSLQKETAERLHLSKEELHDIFAGTREVDHVVYKKK